jgi:hypothetical protein
MGMDGNEIADELARQGSSHPLTGPEPALVYLQRLPWGGDQALDNGQIGNMRSNSSPYVGKGKLRIFFKNLLQKGLGTCET